MKNVKATPAYSKRIRSSGLLHIAGSVHPGRRSVLKIGASIKEYFRKTDFIGRIGGEEFLILLPDTGLETAINRAENIRKRIDRLKWDYEQMHVTISAGVYCFSKHESCDTVLSRADIALYEAKSSGRNLIKAYRYMRG